MWHELQDFVNAVMNLSVPESMRSCRLDKDLLDAKVNWFMLYNAERNSS